jgi:uncharacterized protein YdeI (YjbR/CyaY-like superfamily)
MKPIFFSGPSEFRKWLEDNHNKEKELNVGFYKVGTGKPSMTWSQSVDQALCFGWIDGIRRSIDDESYMIRFTPRKPSSVWSAINIKKIKELTKQGLMHQAGLAAFQKRMSSRSRIYTYEQPAARLLPHLEKSLKSNKKAWKYFQSLAPSYQKLSIKYIMSAKQEATQLKRLMALIKDCELATNQWKDNKYAKKGSSR